MMGKLAIPALVLFAAFVSRADGYIVAVEKSSGRQWRAAADALAKKHSAKTVEYSSPAGFAALAAEMEKSRPKYVCFVTPPGKAGRKFVAAAHDFMRSVGPGPYSETIWGVVTGYCAEDAVALSRAPLSQKVESAATSMGSEGFLDKWQAGIASDENSADNLWVKRRGSAAVKVPTSGNIAKALAAAFNSVALDYFVTSGHASERDWQIIYNRNLGSLVHTPSAGLEFAEPGGRRHKLRSASLKVYIGAGNCLLGHIDSKASMATAWMHSAHVQEFAGYTVPSWYGFMGWGVKDLYETGRHSLAESCYLENQRLVWAGRRSPRGHDAMGLEYDKNTFVYYGDPAQKIMFPEDRTPYTVSVKGGRVRAEFIKDCVFPPLSDVKGARPLTVLLDAPPPGDVLYDAEGREVENSVVTDRFLFIPAPGKHFKGETLEFTIGRGSGRSP